MHPCVGWSLRAKVQLFASLDSVRPIEHPALVGEAVFAFLRESCEREVETADALHPIGLNSETEAVKGLCDLLAVHVSSDSVFID